MRAFVALDLPEDVLDALQALQPGLPVGRAMGRDTMHLTLAFAGEHPQERIEELHDELSRLSAPPFGLQLKGLGSFGGDIPSILFAGVEAEKALEGLARQVRSALRRAGLPVPRDKFRPHVTLARFRPRMGPSELELLNRFVAERAGFRAGPFPVTSFALYESLLHPEGARHRELARYPLG